MQVNGIDPGQNGSSPSLIAMGVEPFTPEPSLEARTKSRDSSA